MPGNVPISPGEGVTDREGYEFKRAKNTARRRPYPSNSKGRCACLLRVSRKGPSPLLGWTARLK
eukprot:2205075-Prymnesium_polylepis.1